MCHRNVKLQGISGLTIMEAVIALVIITIIFAAILPQFRLINNSWYSQQGTAEVIQNGREITPTRVSSGDADWTWILLEGKPERDYDITLRY